MLTRKDFRIDGGVNEWYVLQKKTENYLFQNGQLLDWSKTLSIFDNCEKRYEAVYFDTKKEAEVALEKYLLSITLHGWVIECKKNNNLGQPGDFYAAHAFGSYAGLLENAIVYDTRREARRLTNTDEIVRKVSLDDEGIPIKKIKGR